MPTLLLKSVEVIDAFRKKDGIQIDINQIIEILTTEIPDN